MYFILPVFGLICIWSSQSRSEGMSVLGNVTAEGCCSQPFGTTCIADAKGRRCSTGEVGQIQWGECGQAFGTFPALAYPALHQLGVLMLYLHSWGEGLGNYSQGEFPKHGTSCSQHLSRRWEKTSGLCTSVCVPRLPSISTCLWKTLEISQLCASPSPKQKNKFSPESVTFGCV